MDLRSASVAILLIGAAACGTRDDDGLAGLGTLDPRCESLCADTDPACTAEVAECEPLCQVRVAGMTSLCATCLLEGADSGDCGGGGPCCPDPSFMNDVLTCENSCADSAGVNPAGDHPICTSICSDTDPACSTEVTACFQLCGARIEGVSGLCALCLLDGADPGDCGGGGPCCPDPSFPSSVPACAAVCG